MRCARDFEQSRKLQCLAERTDRVKARIFLEDETQDNISVNSSILRFPGPVNGRIEVIEPQNVYAS